MKKRYTHKVHPQIGHKTRKRLYINHLPFVFAPVKSPQHPQALFESDVLDRQKNLSDGPEYGPKTDHRIPKALITTA